MSNALLKERESSDSRPLAVANEPTSAVADDIIRRWWSGRFGRRVLLEVGLVYGLFLVYKSVRTVTKTDLVAAFANSADVIRFERWLRLPAEMSLQRLMIAQPIVIEFLNRYYVWLHFPVMTVMIVWLYVFRPTVYVPIRNLLGFVTFSALVIHLTYPLAPPRMMGNFVDTVAVYGPSVYPANPLNGAANQIAAMPSLHFGWAVIEVIAIVWAFNSRWRWLAAIHPVIMLTAIVATANHWWTDALVAGVLIGAGSLVLQGFQIGQGDPADLTVRGKARGLDSRFAPEPSIPLRRVGAGGSSTTRARRP